MDKLATSKLVWMLLLISVVKCDELSVERENSGNGLDSEEEAISAAKGRNFGNTIKDCIQTCRRLLFRGDRDLNYCIEGCRIRIYRKIYECVYDQCNEKGNGIPTKFSREQYHQCVYLCKVKPKVKPTKPSMTSSTTTTSTASPLNGLSTAKTSVIKESSKLHFIPLEYHYFNDKKRKTSNKNPLN